MAMVSRLVGALLLVAAPVFAQGLPEGWSARPDRGEVSGVKFAAMGGGFHVSGGSAAVIYREADKGPGNFHTVVTFTQTKAPTHPEGYGLVFGGSDLAGADQSYVYFLVRGDGKYLVKKRAGANTTDVVTWTDSDAIQKGDEAGKATNKLEIDASGPKVVFKVNGKTVYELEGATKAGIVGLRVNHGLDVHIAGFAVHKM
jgi:hypothetical protein